MNFKHGIFLLGLVPFALGCGGSGTAESGSEGSQPETGEVREVPHGNVSSACMESVKKYEKLANDAVAMARKKADGQDVSGEEKQLQKESEELAARIQRQLAAHHDTDCARAFANAQARIAKAVTDAFMPEAQE